MGALVAGLAALNVLPASAESSGQTPKATEVGVTSSEIQSGSSADVETRCPGLVQGCGRWREGGAAYLNSKAGGGGLAGRKVVVDFNDTHSNPNEARNATITACQDDLALVGTATLFLTRGHDISTARTRRPGHRATRPVVGHDGCARDLRPDLVPRVRGGDRLRNGHAEPSDLLRQPGPAKWSCRSTRAASTVRCWSRATRRTPTAAARSSPSRPEGGHQGRPGHHDRQVGS